MRERKLLTDKTHQKLKKKINNIYSNLTEDKYKFVILNKDIQEKFKINFEINLANDKNSITYSWNIEQVTNPDDSMISIYNQIITEIDKLNRVEPDYMGMMDPIANNVIKIKYTEKFYN